MMDITSRRRIEEHEEHKALGIAYDYICYQWCPDQKCTFQNEINAICQRSKPYINKIIPINLNKDKMKVYYVCHCTIDPIESFLTLNSVNMKRRRIHSICKFPTGISNLR